MKILFVDDEPEILMALRRTLRKERYEIVCSSSAAEALEELRRTRYDVIVSDNRMPETTGVELLRRVRSEHPDTLRILMSAVPDSEDKRHAQEDGSVDWFIEKPWDQDALRELLRAIAGVRVRPD